MPLYIKQAVFSWRGRFYIKDAEGIDRYYAEGRVFSFGKKLTVYDQNGRERLFLKQVLMSMMPRYDLFIDGQAVCQVHMRPALVRSRFEIYGLNWHVDGDFWAHDYQISSGNEPIAMVRKAWFTWGDSYRIDCANPENELLVLGIVLAIDSAQHEGDS